MTQRSENGIKSAQGTGEEEVPFEAIAAAVAYMLGQPHRLLAVHPIESTLWSMEGRREIFSSHALFRR